MIINSNLRSMVVSDMSQMVEDVGQLYINPTDSNSFLDAVPIGGSWIYIYIKINFNYNRTNLGDSHDIYTYNELIMLMLPISFHIFSPSKCVLNFPNFVIL